MRKPTPGPGWSMAVTAAGSSAVACGPISGNKPNEPTDTAAKTVRDRSMEDPISLSRMTRSSQKLRDSAGGPS